MGLKVTNNAFGTLNAGINSSATTIVLTAGQGARFPTLSAGDYFYATLIDTSNNLEIVKVTARSTDTMTVVRGQDNTTARAYSTNDRFELRPTAALFNEKANDADVAAGYVAKSGSTMTGQLINNVGFALDTDVTSAPDGKVYLQKRSAGAYLSGYQAIIETGSAGSRLERVRVDFDGRMTTPYQPTVICGAGSASRSAGTYQHWGTSGYVWTNIGSHWNASTGRFTAPVAGRYLVRAALRFSSETSTSYNYIQFNNSNTAQSGQPIRLWTPDGGAYRPHELSYILYLNANDWVEPRVYLNASATFDGGNVGQTDDGLQIIYLG